MKIFDRTLLNARKKSVYLEKSDFQPLINEICENILDRLSFIKREFKDVLLLGHHASILAPHLSNLNTTLVEDDETPELPEHKFDLILSFLSMHWVNDLPGTLAQIKRALKPDGIFLTVMLGEESLIELEQSLLEAEQQLKGGISPRTSPRIDARTMGALLQRAGFTLPVVDRDRYTLTYPNLNKLLKDIKALGENNTQIERLKTFAPKQLFTETESAYKARFMLPEGLKTTVDVIYASGWAPHPSQQKALKPGDFKKPLLDALKPKN